MDMEKLTKSQIVLLTLLVSFMTSIATGIVTVSLMQQAPPAITQTVSKVIEHTVEKVAPSQSAAVAMGAAAKQESASTPQSSVSDAIATADPSVVRLFSSSAGADTDSSTFLGLGVAVSSQTVVTDINALAGAGDAMVQVPGGKQVHMSVQVRDQARGLAYLTGSSTAAVSWTPAAIATEHPILGQTIIALSGKSATKIAVGVITALSPLSDEDKIPVLETNIQDSDIISGSPIIDTDGNVIGVSTIASRASSKSAFLSATGLQTGKI